MVAQENNYDVNTNVSIEEHFLSNQEIANDLHMRFLNSLFCGNSEKNRQHYSIDGYEANDYPPYYGGSYINSDGNMVVLINDMNPCDAIEEKEWYNDFCARVNSNQFVVRYVDCNLTTLINTADEIVFGKLKNVLKNYSYKGMSIRCSENCLYVYLENEKDVAPVNELLKNKPCKVVYNDETYSFSVGLYGGEGIALSSSLSEAEFSVAFRVKKTVNYSTYYAYLTCGHAFYGNSANVYLPHSETGMSSSVLIGTVSSTEQQCSGNTDAAIIRLGNNTTPYNSIFLTSTQIHAGTYINLQEGNTVYMRGRNSGVLIGEVKDISFSPTINGTTFYDLVKTDYHAANGDSGGAVYSQPNSYYYAYAAGIQTGIAKNPLGNTDYSFYTKVNNAVNTLGFALY
ncbi:MAG: hypothetical protein IK055_06290 [Lachnospiraceae bacterium]|nr:hypothetical protein [Lachnospiraceae bacterium]